MITSVLEVKILTLDYWKQQFYSHHNMHYCSQSLHRAYWGVQFLPSGVFRGQTSNLSSAHLQQENIGILHFVFSSLHESAGSELFN